MQKVTIALTLLCLFLFPAIQTHANFFGDILNQTKEATEKVISGTFTGDNQKHPEQTPPPKSVTKSSNEPSPVNNHNLVKQIQISLNQLGFKAGSPDGLYGPGTRKAILAFQAQQGLPGDGQPSQSLLGELKSAEKASAKEAFSTTEDVSTSVALPDSGVRTPANETTFALARIQFDPSWLDNRERLESLTMVQIGMEKHQGGGISGHPPFFNPDEIADREPQFAARELAPVMRKRLLQIAGDIRPGFVYEANWMRPRYDFKNQSISFKGRMFRPASEKERVGLPALIKDRALYQIPKGPSFYKETILGIAANIEPAAKLLAFDRELNLESIKISPQQAEKIVALGRPLIRLEFRITGTVDGILLAKLEGLQVSSAPNTEPLLSIGPEGFPSALAENALTAGPPPTVIRDISEAIVSAAEPDMADLLLLHYFPERLDDDYLFVLMQERQRFERSSAKPPWGRFFNLSARDIDRGDLAVYGPVFKKWTLERAARLNDRVAIRVERQRVGYNPNSQTANITFSSSSSCLQQRNAILNNAKFGIAVKSTRDQCGKQRYQWKRSPEVVVNLDKQPLPPPPEVAAKLAAKYIPMEILVRITDKKFTGDSGEGDQLMGELLEIRYFDTNDKLVAKVKPSVAAEVVAYDPLARAKSGTPYGPDVVGIQLGMQLKDAETAIRAHAAVMDYFQGKAPFPFSGAHLFVLGDGGEYITLFTIRDNFGERVAALQRNVWYLPSAAPADTDVISALDDKYGKATIKRDSYGSLTERWVSDAANRRMESSTAKNRGCLGLMGSPKSYDVFLTAKGPYYWALPGLDKVWGRPTNGFGIDSNGKSAADIAICGTELHADWRHNDGEIYGLTLTIDLYDAPWIWAQAEAAHHAVPKIGL